MLPVICVVVAVTCCGVDIVSDQPVEVLVATYANGLHVLLGDILAVCVEVAQNHHVLKQTGVCKRFKHTIEAYKNSKKEEHV